MTFLHMARVAFWVSVWPAGGLGAQTRADTSAIEVVAARAMLARGTAAAGVGVDPGLARHGHAPGPAVPGSARSAARSEALMTALGPRARVVRFADARRCGPRTSCPMSGIAVHLTLSDPLIDGDSARITVTRTENTGHPFPATNYETILFTLKRDAGNWVVIRAEQLGIS